MDYRMVLDSLQQCSEEKERKDIEKEYVYKFQSN